MRIAVCSWSLRPEGPEDLVEKVRRTGVSAVQLALDPVRTAWGSDETRSALADAGIPVVSGMVMMDGEDYSTLETIRLTGGVRSDTHWEANLAASRENAALARALGIDLVTFHAGFIPHEADDPVRETMLERLRAVIDAFAEHDVAIAFETGQETADTLAAALRDLDRPAGVNFDPANMILYGMGDPIRALSRLAPHVRQVHIKDALPAGTPGEWGVETVAGHGEVQWSLFLQLVSGFEDPVDLVVEREGGDERVLDVRTAVGMLRQTAAELGIGVTT